MDFSKIKNYADFKRQTGMSDQDSFYFLRNELVKRGVLKQE